MLRLMRPFFQLLEGIREARIDFLIAIAMNLAFLVLITLLLWPLDKAVLAFRLAKGYSLFWLVVFAVAAVVAIIQENFRVNLYDHFDAFLITNICASALLMMGWSAFAALTLRSSLAGAQVWITACLCLVAFLSTYIAFTIVTSFYQGSIYKMIGLGVTCVSFLVFALWPASGQAVYGWFFALF